MATGTVRDQDRGHEASRGIATAFVSLSLALGMVGLVDAGFLDHAIRDGIGRQVGPAIAMVRRDLDRSR